MKKILPLVLSLILFFTPMYAFASGGGGGNGRQTHCRMLLGYFFGVASGVVFLSLGRAQHDFGTQHGPILPPKTAPSWNQNGA